MLGNAKVVIGISARAGERVSRSRSAAVGRGRVAELERKIDSSAGD